MASITLRDVKKVYPNGFEAVHGLDLSIDDGQLMVLVGPSGCGKTTVLRMVAGLEDISGGTLHIGERLVNQVVPKDRDIAMVFQNYALYPHMTVAENIGFALGLRRIRKSEVQERVREAARLLGLTQLLEQKPGQLSGGQRQRVAMGRAIVREPSVFLMDEPLSNLDAKLRVELRAEISRIQRRLGVATIYVTHDQTEAMTLGDKVAVLRGGFLQQCEAPQLLYDRPKNMFVAEFIGSPAINLYACIVSEDAATLALGSQQIRVDDALRTAHPRLASYAGSEVALGVRPEDLTLAGTRDDEASLEGDVELIESLGSEILVHFSIDAARVHAEGAREADREGIADGGELTRGDLSIARLEPRTPVRPGERVRFHVRPAHLHFFDLATEESL
ncbi:MAG: ABC transporter ATP-binding protein [Gaiellaceae bacterium]